MNTHKAETETETLILNTPEIIMPTRKNIEDLKVGDVAPFVFGESKVVEIHARREDVNGRLFVCYYVEWGANGGRMSASMKEGEIVRTLAVTNAYTSSEIHDLEARQALEVT